MFNNVQFIKSAAKAKDFLPDEGIEIAFAGRSNAGKSSTINVLCNSSGLARVSKTPGRTQLINFFNLEGQAHLVDLPGYGYAKVPQTVKLGWQNTLADYLNTRQALKGLILLMDIRHTLKEFDLQLLNWASTRMPLIGIHILLTKADKLNRGPGTQSLLKVKNDLKKLGYPATVQLFSALYKMGLDELKQKIRSWLA